VNPVFWLGCYGCIFHGTGNSAQLYQNLGISGGWPPQTSHLGTPLCLAIEPRKDPIALREGFRIWGILGKSFCINVSVIVECVLQLRQSLVSNLH
jgi:hypothetical protein